MVFYYERYEKVVVGLGLVLALALSSFSTASAAYENGKFSEMSTTDKVDALESSAGGVLLRYGKVGKYLYGEYEQIGGNSYRMDCSGYVNAVLYNAGVSNKLWGYTTNDYFGDKKVIKTMRKNGFSYRDLKINKMKSFNIVVRDGSIKIVCKAPEGFYTNAAKAPMLKHRGYRRLNLTIRLNFDET